MGEMVAAKRGAVTAPRGPREQRAPLARASVDAALDEALGRVAPRAPAGAVAAIRSFLALVTEWGPRVDLTAARDARELVDLFLADAALLAEAAGEAPTARWVDVGSGAGAPGMVLALLAPELQVTLVEPRAKRAAFLRTAIGALRLGRVELLPRRSEALPSGGFDVAVSRATFPPAEWLREGARLAPRVWVLLARGAPPSLAGWGATADRAYSWPLTGAPRRALRFEIERVAG